MPPSRSDHYQAVIPSNKMNEELTCFGFVRSLWQNKEFEHILFPPYYLIQIITFFYNKEYLHLIDVGMDNGNHWRIKVDEIID